MDDDALLLDRWRSGDTAAGKELFARYFPRLYRFFANKCDDPEDMVQQTFLALVKARDQFAGRAAFRSYVYTVARHELYHHLQSRRRERGFDPEVSSIADLITTAGTKLARNQEHQLLCAALRTLSVEQQTLLELHYWDGLDAAALADIFGTNAAAIRNRLTRARRNLRDALMATPGIAPEVLSSDDALDALARSVA